MSYEKVKIGGIRTAVNKKTGQIHHFLQVELLQSYDIYLNDDAVKCTPQYEAMKGQEALLPVTWGEYQGKPNLNLADDYHPLPVSSRSSVPAAVLPQSQTAESSQQPLFKSKAG